MYTHTPIPNSIFSEELAQLIAEVKHHVEHPFVLKYIELPKLDLFQLHFTFLFLQSKRIDLEFIRDICLPFLYIQLALDTHEQVPVKDQSCPSPQEIKWQQLTVLSGDLTSSYYYHYLAERNKVDEIRFWTKGIQRINELKMQRHLLKQNQQTDFEQLEQSIKSYLVSTILDRFQAEQIWYDILASYTFLLNLAEENDQVVTQMDKLRSLFSAVGKQNIYIHELEQWQKYIKADYLVHE